jgi:choline dehydrogenase-like flavoprotein
MQQQQRKNYDAAQPDVIIVGSGAGGAAAAYRLALAGFQVLLLEKGMPLPRDGSTLDDTEVVARGRFLSKEPWLDGAGRSICPEEHFNLGGKTKWYGAAVLRYSAAEFEPEPKFAAFGWPVKHADLTPFYDEAEALLKVRSFDCEPNLKRILAGLRALDAAWDSQPLPMALSPNILRDPLEATHFDGFASIADLKGDAENSFLKLITDNPNFTLRTASEVVELLPAATGAGRIAGVRLASGEDLSAPLVLLAAGTLHSPRLLQRYLDASRQAAASFALPSAPLVGRHLKKHLLTALVAVSFRKQTDVLRKTMLTTHARYPHSSVQPLGFDGELIATLVPKWVPRFLARAVGRRAYGFFLQTEDGSHPDNRVAERAQQPILDYSEQRLPASSQEHRAFTHAFQRALLRIGMLSFTQRVGLNGTAHVSGTLLTGASPHEAVVDANGKVFGIEGLYVVDGSVLPRSSRVNPSLSIYAWALRVADLLSTSRQERRG